MKSLKFGLNVIMIDFVVLELSVVLVGDKVGSNYCLNEFDNRVILRMIV